VFQDIFYKVGVIEMGKGNWEVLLKNLKHAFLQFPGQVNWTYKVDGEHINHLKAFYKGEQISLESELCGSEQSNLLEAINLALFNLNNEEMD